MHFTSPTQFIIHYHFNNISYITFFIGQSLAIILFNIFLLDVNFEKSIILDNFFFFFFFIFFIFAKFLKNQRLIVMS